MCIHVCVCIWLLVWTYLCIYVFVSACACSPFLSDILTRPQYFFISFTLLIVLLYCYVLWCCTFVTGQPLTLIKMMNYIRLIYFNWCLRSNCCNCWFYKYSKGYDDICAYINSHTTPRLENQFQAMIKQYYPTCWQPWLQSRVAFVSGHSI